MVVLLSLRFTAVRGDSQTQLCFITYSQPGDIDYPWSAAVSLFLDYNVGLQTDQYGTYQACYGGIGTYTYTNKFGNPTTHKVTLDGGADLYIGTDLPVDLNGIRLNFQDVPDVQLPGVGPVVRYDQIAIQAGPGFVGLAGSDPELDNTFRIDPLGQAWLSPYPGFVNQSIPAANINAPVIDLVNCKAPIDSRNGGAIPGYGYAPSFTYQYTIGDGSTWEAVTIMKVTASKDLYVDELGNQYQTIADVTGTRKYTWLPTGMGSTSAIPAIDTNYDAPSQRWYPFALTQAATGVYNTSTAPYLDGDGLAIRISPAMPINGEPAGGSITDIIVSFALSDPNDPSSALLLTESNTETPLSSSVQSQIYTQID